MNNHLKRHIHILLVILGFLLLPTYSAQAEMLKMGLEDLTKKADAIIVGTVINCSSEWNADHTNISTTATISVEDNLKGKDHFNEVTVTVSGGQVEDITEIVSDEPIFICGEKTVVFIDQSEKNKTRVCGGVQGKLDIREDKVGKIPIAELKDKINKVLQGQLITGDVDMEEINIEEIGGPAISWITPDSASAGTNSQVAISGSGFGDTPGQVFFFYRAGQPNIEGTIVSWSDTGIIVNVPTGVVNNSSATASSGPLFMRTAGGIDSNIVPFTVTFSNGAKKWSATDPLINYMVNPSEITGAITALQNAANSWSNVPYKNFSFNYNGQTSSTSASLNGTNEIMWNTLSSGIIGQAYYWYSGGALVEADMVFSDKFSWSTTTPLSNQMDVETIALHELGHWLVLRDLYGNQSGFPQDAEKVMYGFCGYGQVKRTLHNGDIAGIRYIYPNGILDTTTPQVSSSDPVSGASGVSLDKAIVVYFDEPIAQGGTYSSITLKDGLNNDVTFNGSISGSTLTIDPAGNFGYSSTYTLAVPADAVQDLAGNGMAGGYNLSFGTVNAPDTTAPRVSSSDPVSGASGVSLDKTIVVYFDEPIAQGGTYNSITLKDGLNNDVSFNGSISGSTLTIDPAGNFGYSGTYTLAIPAGAVQDLAGNGMAGGYNLSFGTINAPDTTAPRVSSSDPVSGAIGVSLDKTIVVYFDEPIAQGSTYSSITLKDGLNNDVSFNGSISGSTLTIDPAGNFGYSGTYTLAIPAGAVQDLAGNGMAGGYNLSFGTVSAPDVTTLKIDSTNPVNGASGVSIDKTIIVTFNKPIVQSVNFRKITLKIGKTKIAFTTKISGNTLIIDPVANLVYNGKYTLTIPVSAVKDSAGYLLAQSYSLTFTTTKS
jgi:hypothetical protein